MPLKMLEKGPHGRRIYAVPEYGRIKKKRHGIKCPNTRLFFYSVCQI
jgi:hypothetical protein